MGPNITIAYFLILFPEFQKIAKEKLDAFIGIATNRVPSAVWGANTQYGTALLTAHMLATSGKQGEGAGGGAVSQESVGDLSRSYAQVFSTDSGDAVLMTTRYGVDFVALRSETIVSATTMVNIAAVASNVPWCW